MSENSRSFALLIDGDNVQLAHLPHLLNEIYDYRKPIINRVYLNKSSIEQIPQWEPLITNYSLDPVFVPNNTISKNAVDMALVIEAMELLYTRQDITHFFLVSSDSDFTQLAKHIVSQGRTIIGFGEAKTPNSFQRACSNFVMIETLLPDNGQVKEDATDALNTLSYADDELEELLILSYENAPKDEDEWSQLLDIKLCMAQFDPKFESREYHNTKRLADKMKALAAYYPEGVIEVDERLNGTGIIHDIRIDCDTFRFIRAYIASRRASSGSNGWIPLSAIGGQLRKYNAYTDGYRYHGMKKSLLILLTQMSNDYPKMLKLKKGDKGDMVYLNFRLV